MNEEFPSGTPDSGTPDKDVNNDRRQRKALIMALHQNGGKKTFIVGQTSVQVLRCLVDLTTERVIEEVPNPNPLLRTYYLKQKP